MNYNYFEGKLYNFYFTEGSRDQFGWGNSRWRKICNIPMVKNPRKFLGSARRGGW